MGSARNATHTPAGPGQRTRALLFPAFVKSSLIQHVFTHLVPVGPFVSYSGPGAGPDDDAKLRPAANKAALTLSRCEAVCKTWNAIVHADGMRLWLPLIACYAPHWARVSLMGKISGPATNFGVKLTRYLHLGPLCHDPPPPPYAPSLSEVKATFKNQFPEHLV